MSPDFYTPMCIMSLMFNLILMLIGIPIHFDGNSMAKFVFYHDVIGLFLGLLVSVPMVRANKKHSQPAIVGSFTFAWILLVPMVSVVWLYKGYGRLIDSFYEKAAVNEQKKKNQENHAANLDEQSKKLDKFIAKQQRELDKLK